MEDSKKNRNDLIKELEGLKLEYESAKELYSKESKELKKALKALQENEEKYRRIVETAIEGIISLDGEARITFVNRQLAEMFGYSTEEMVGKLFGTFMAEDQLSDHEAQMKSRKQGENSIYERCFIKKDGCRLWALVSAKAVIDPEGNLIESVAMLTDITELKEVEHALNYEQSFTKKILDSLPGIFYLYSYPELRLLLWNKSHETSLGFESGEINNRHISEWHLPEVRETLLKTVDDVMVKGQSFIEASLLAKDGHLVPFYMSGAKFESNDRLYLMGVGVDISEKKRLEYIAQKKEEVFKILLELHDKSPDMTIRELFGFAVNKVVKLTDSKVGFLYQVSDDQEKITLTICSDEALNNCTSVCNENYPVSQAGNWTDCIKQKKSIIYNDCAALPNPKSLLPDHTPVKRFMSIPVLVNSKVGLVFGIGNKEAEYSDFDAENIEIIGIELHKILEKQITDETLLKSEEKFRSVTQSAKDAIITVDSKGIIVGWNKGAERTFGYTEAEIMGRSMNTIIPSSYHEIHSEGMQNLAKGGKSNVVGATVKSSGVDKSGKEIPLEFTLAEWRTGTGKFFTAIIRDISERKFAEKKITQLSRAVEQSPISVIITDMQGKIEYINPKLSEITGYQPEELIGRNPRIFKSGVTSREEYKALWETISSGNEWKGEFRNKKKNGEFYWEFASILPIKDDTGHFSNYLAYKTDITKDKEIEQELIRSLKRAEESDKLKSNLLANMSHEFRTPMNGILGMVSILKEEVQDIEHITKITQIGTSAKRLMITLDSVLVLAQLEGNENEYPNMELLLNEKLKNECNKYVKRAEANNLTFNFDITDEDIFINGNELLLRQILSYLIDNAIKFTEKGAITISLSLETEPDCEYAILSVIDTGIGISEENRQIIFKEFRQASEGYNRTHEGIGLGLTLVNKIAALMKWSLSVKSKLNEGSCFSLRIPILKNEGEGGKIVSMHPVANTDKKSSSDERKNILYVEDNAINSLVVRTYVREYYTYDGAANANKALEKVKDKRYDLILMDINLGLGMNGIELAKKIREMATYKNTPIIAVTGYAMQNDKTNILHDGMTDYLAKPFEKSELLDILRKYL